MDYKYIEQLLERYWECQTTLEEEAILRTFFRQEDVPASLLPFRQLFVEEDEMTQEHLGEDFADRMLALVDEKASLSGERKDGCLSCKAHRLTFMRRLRPFYRAAGLIAIMLTIGNAAHQSFVDEDVSATSQMAETTAIDSLQQISIGSSDKQSAALTAQPTDTLKEYPR